MVPASPPASSALDPVLLLVGLLVAALALLAGWAWWRLRTVATQRQHRALRMRRKRQRRAAAPPRPASAKPTPPKPASGQGPGPAAALAPGAAPSPSTPAPATRLPGGPSASTVHHVPADAPEYRPLILVVDDSRSALANAKKVLDTQPYRVALAENGRQAWALLQDQKPDLIISDIDMPLMTGFELLKLVREDLRLADLPFILMTSHLYTHLHASQSAGFDSLLPKPYSPEDLVEQVRFLLQE